MGKFVPSAFKPRDADIEWAMDKFRISRKEFDNQWEQLQDHEFKRSYTDWNRVLRNSDRTADKHNLLFRERKPRGVEVVSEEQRREDAEKAVIQMAKYRSMK